MPDIFHKSACRFRLWGLNRVGAYRYPLLITRRRLLAVRGLYNSMRLRGEEAVVVAAGAVGLQRRAVQYLVEAHPFRGRCFADAE